MRNLREIAATAHFTVPRTYEMLLPASCAPTRFCASGFFQAEACSSDAAAGADPGRDR